MAFRGEHSLDLPSGAIAIVGRYVDDQRRSNWAGKTALLEAIEWALDGTHRKRYEDDVLHRGTDECEVSIELGEGVRVTRSRKRGKSTALQVDVDGERTDGKAAQFRVVELLGMDHADFRATLCFAQGDTHAIVSRTSGDRHKVIAQWLDLDAWGRVHARASAERGKLLTRLEGLRRDRTRLDERLSQFEYPAEDRGELVAELSECDKRVADCEYQMTAASELQAAWDAKVALQGATKDLKELRESLNGAGLVSDDADREEIGRLSVNAESLRVSIVKSEQILAGDFDGECPHTRTQCPSREFVESCREEISERRDEERMGLRELDVKLQESRSRANESARLARDIEHRRARYNAIVSYARSLREKAANAPINPPDVETESANIRAANENLRVATAAVDAYDRKVCEHESMTAEGARLDAAVKAAELALRIANVAVDAVSSTGAPADIARESLQVLESRANALLEPSRLSFTFSWDRPAKGLSAACPGCGYPYRGQRDKRCPSCDAERPQKRSNELEILVSDGSGVEEDVRAKSGGAQSLVAASIRLAAGAMLREVRGSAMAFALVDEPFGALDAVNRSSLATTFAAMLSSVGLEQALVVSHDVALLDALPSSIEVLRHSRHSTVSVVS